MVTGHIPSQVELTSPPAHRIRQQALHRASKQNLGPPALLSLAQRQRQGKFDKLEVRERVARLDAERRCHPVEAFMRDRKVLVIDPARKFAVNPVEL